MNEEIVKPTHTRRPDFITGISNSKFYVFECLSCGSKLQLNYEEQINNTWAGKRKELSQQECMYLIKYYRIGFSKKSREGGFPVFGKIYCQKCNTGYYTYVGLDEIRNSVHHVQIQGIMKFLTYEK